MAGKIGIGLDIDKQPAAGVLGGLSGALEASRAGVDDLGRWGEHVRQGRGAAASGTSTIPVGKGMRISIIVAATAAGCSSSSSLIDGLPGIKGGGRRRSRSRSRPPPASSYVDHAIVIIVVTVVVSGRERRHHRRFGSRYAPSPGGKHTPRRHRRRHAVAAGRPDEGLSPGPVRGTDGVGILEPPPTSAHCAAARCAAAHCAAARCAAAHCAAVVLQPKADGRLHVAPTHLQV